MTEINKRSTNEIEDTASEQSSWWARLPVFVWAGISVVFLVYIAFGSVEARIWTYGRLTFQDRGIAHVWRYFGDNLPDMPGGPLFPFLYYLSLGVMIVGTIAGTGLFLLSGNDETSTSSTPVLASTSRDE